MRLATLCAATLACGCGLAFSPGGDDDGGATPTTSVGGSATGGVADGGMASTGAGGASTGTGSGLGGAAEGGGGGVGGEGGRGPTCTPVFEDTFTTFRGWDVGTSGSGSNVYLDQGTLAFDSGTGSALVLSQEAYPVSSCGVIVEEAMSPTNGGLAWLYVADVVNVGYRASFVHEADVLQARFVEGAPPAAVLHQTPFDEVAHRWWRLRRTAAQVIWDVSPDGVSWTQWHSEPAPPWGAGNNNVSLGVTAAANVTVAKFDNLSVLVPSLE